MNEAGFPRTARLLTAADFDACFKARQRLQGRYFILQWCAGRQSARLGLAVSRKVDGRAVVRNRIKRCTRETFRRHRHRLAALDLVVSAKREAARQTNDALCADLDSLFARLPSLPLPDAQGTMRADFQDPTRIAVTKSV